MMTIDEEKLLARVVNALETIARNKMGAESANFTTDDFTEDLEKEIDKRYLQARVVGYVDGVGEIILGREAFERIARHFANWQNEQMLKDAVDGEVVMTNGGYLRITSANLDDKVDLKFGDKVKVIILQENRKPSKS